ncbi:hypothetical protein L6270_03425 [Candidatus Parcubacteria bacterium]|nr:hypothetical protein [Patescibacteria group bacterium]MBU4309014.1 hypothetical protein [Patescibacteria group bacterium]MBU4432391.1 hypothetical protein [Patescibacteria group bacterium]MBU4577375.1 hypothetical protein [Patescibacteria group bacterium]MCG2697063.1 hypothetical protein [Candidatus Parcubacteria bacterium]
MKKNNYNVAFAFTKEAGGYEGVITWTSFPSKKYFDQWYTDDIKSHQRVVEEGITPERAVYLANSTPLACREAAALQDATDQDTGEVNQDILAMKLATAYFAKRL